MKSTIDTRGAGENSRTFRHVASGSSMSSRAGQRQKSGVMTLTETVLGHASRGDTLANEQNHRDVSVELTEHVDGGMNRAMDELDRLSISMLAKAESYPIDSGKSGDSSLAMPKKSKSVTFE